MSAVLSNTSQSAASSPAPGDPGHSRTGRQSSFQVRETPLTLLPRFSAAMGAPVFVKQDDVGPLSWAGTKSRKIYRILEDAIEHDVEVVVMCGPAQSNSCRALAAAAAAMGIKAILLLRGNPPDEITGNLRILQSVGAELRWAGDVRWPDLSVMATELVQSLQNSGTRAMEVATGCSSVQGVRAIVDAALELQRQLDAIDVRPARIVHASASGGMHAGLAIAHHLYGTPQPHSVMIVREIYDDVEAEYGRLIARSLAKLSLPDVTLPPIALDWSQVGPGYGDQTPQSREAGTLLARTEGLLVDPVYTGKGLAAVPELAAAHPGEPLVFWHTGGLPAYFIQ